MKLYGSLDNRLMETTKPVEPKVGDGATVIMYSDRHAATIVHVHESKKKIEIQYDSPIRTDNNGMSDSQAYEYKRNPNGSLKTVTLRKDGRWKISNDGTIVVIGYRDHYHDYGF